MQSMFSHARRTITSTLAMFALAFSLGGCATEVDSSLPNTAVYEVSVSAEGATHQMSVKVSGSAAEDYQDITGEALDADEVNALVGERILKAVDEGAIELSSDPNAEIEVVFDIAQNVPDPTTLKPADACVVSWGIATYSYKITVRDSYGCRYYDVVDYFDLMHNNCNGANTLQYLFTKQYGPYWGC